jgi:hypothetical protein
MYRIVQNSALAESEVMMAECRGQISSSSHLERSHFDTITAVCKSAMVSDNRSCRFIQGKIPLFHVQERIFLHHLIFVFLKINHRFEIYVQIGICEQ